MVSAPLMLLLYDRTFVASSLREAWSRRRGIYVGVACTWLLLGFLVAQIGGTRGSVAGLGLGVSAFAYALKQCEAIVRYLVEPRRAGSVKSRLVKKMLDRLNEEPERVMFPNGNSR